MIYSQKMRSTSLRIIALLLSSTVSATYAEENAFQKILSTSQHDSNSYTQGLEIHDGKFYESSGAPIIEATGQRAKSFVTSYSENGNKKTVKVEKICEMLLTGNEAEDHCEDVFAEGLTIHKDEVFLLTWKKRDVYVLTTEALEPLRKLRLPVKFGWGLASDGENLILSDGSSTLYTLNAADLSILEKIKVKKRRWSLFSQNNLNELEFVGEFIYANVYLSRNIVKIDPRNGLIECRMDFSKMTANMGDNKDSVLNGIAFDTASSAFWITGKFWKKRYLVNFC